MAGLSNVTAIAGGAYHSLALTGGGQVYAFGLNYYGQLGSTTNNGTVNPNPTPTLVAGLSNVTAIAGGGSHSLALTGGGQVYAFGYNFYGQLGSTTNNGTTNANPTPTLVAGLANITGIAAGQYHSLALTGGGNVFSFGYNVAGQLGNGTTNTTANPTPYEVQYNGANLANIVQVAAGQYSSYALDNAGDLYVWGDNSSGQFGLGNTTSKFTPQLLLPPTGQYYQFIESDANGSFALAILGSTPPVPEPATWLAGALLVAGSAWTLRRRLRLPPRA